MEHYLDNSATTRVLPEAAEKAAFLMTERIRQPQLPAHHGLRCPPGGGGGPIPGGRPPGGGGPGDRLYQRGHGEQQPGIVRAALARKRLGNKIVTTAAEHDSVLGPCRELAKWGFQVVELKPDRQGRLPEEALLEAIDGQTILVSVMLVNNETGAIFPVEAAAPGHPPKKAPALLHVDAVQAFGKLPFTPKKLGVDLVTVSAHKIHGPKGIGALYVGKGVRILPHVFGGGQERGLRSGTESAPADRGFWRGGAAAARSPGSPGEGGGPQRPAPGKAPGASGRHRPLPGDGLPYVLNFSAGAVRERPCSTFWPSGKCTSAPAPPAARPSPATCWRPWACPPQQVSSALRASFSRFSTREDVEALAQGLQEGLERLARG